MELAILGIYAAIYGLVMLVVTGLVVIALVIRWGRWVYQIVQKGTPKV